MFPPLSVLTHIANQVLVILASPAQKPLEPSPRPPPRQLFDVQAHRGGRGNTIENTLPSFAWGLIDGATTLELDNGITKDGVVVVWHDNSIAPEKCIDTSPAFSGDPDFPYVGKYVANLTFAQLRTLDCGSKRQADYPMQLTYPGTRISTMQEVFEFVECADPGHQIRWNIESKINAQYPERTRGVQDFVRRQSAVFRASPYYSSITYQSFDWRTLVAMKDLDPSMPISALIDDDTGFMPDNTTTPWLAGLRLDSFPGPTLGHQVAQAAHAIGADILSSSASSYFTPAPDPLMESYVAFTTKEMVDEGHRLDMSVKVWTVNRLNEAEKMFDYQVDGIITDYPSVLRRIAKQHGLPVAPKYPKQRVFACLDEHLARQRF
ncbi:hypothetical protein POSPLADRAFT_1052063 [Postia placenta MAD-698-R-SB12]|uniref:GP-PDE domain-containing protein n=1 Tax=Postia placenta MAD-698-R-SB12 TaxID=670580 RepID=A0A1X6NH37_9APHY|nr:hypothetical protein POSPLADRAFT_1052063 [Postia placenta MAD-698-R-SB12]OSX67957.1 hypothetical protein POSPLADRAFT_1052063 [Postia placenta MAD-698-R-SB12]